MCQVTNAKRAVAAGAIKRAPSAKPAFTIGTLRKAIPKHCFERSLLHSTAYLVVDLIVIACLYYASTLIDASGFSAWVRYGLLWPAYWFCQGAVATGVWVIAHECGHQAFSKYQAINDGVGLVLHSLLLVPYYSWKHSHRRHHSNTGSLDKDEVFVPNSRPEVDDKEWKQVPLVRLFFVVMPQLAGWPLYLLFNVTGNKSYPKSRWVNHFDPYSPIFSKRERVEVAISDAALVAVFYTLYSLAHSFGWAWLVKTYVIPYLWVNHWLVMITLLQHTHPALPHYDEREWDWLRGALATVDRSYGFLDIVHHHLADTHVAHHLFSQIPHYHAQEVTEAIKPILGDYYQRDDRNVFAAWWADTVRTRYVAPDTPGGATYWFRK